MIASTKLEGKVAIITGAGSGFGEGIVTKFLAEGANVLILDINLANAEKVAAAAPLGRAKGIKADVSVQIDWEKALETVLAEFGKLDVVVNNAGVNHAFQVGLCSRIILFDPIFSTTKSKPF